MGDTRRYAEKMNLAAMTPHPELVSTRYCLANPGEEYLVYLQYDIPDCPLCQRVPCVVVDDLGTERLTEWAAEVLFRIFNARYVAKAHALVASNVRPEDLAEPRLRSRFLDVAVCHRVPNGGDDYRQGKGRAEVRA